MATIVAGPLLGTLFGQLAAAIKDAVISAIHFRDRLESLQRTLTLLEPIMEEIDSLNEPLDRQKEEMGLLRELLENGEVLVRKAPRVTLYKRASYSDKLKDLEDNIIKFCQLHGMVNSRDTKQVLVEIQMLRTDVRRLISMQEGKSSGKGTRCEIYSCEVPKAPEYVVGLDESIEELKSHLLARGVSAIVVSAFGGGGKTTLVKTLVNKKEIKDKFKNKIFFVTFSKSPDFKAIVQSMLNHAGKNVPPINEDQAKLELPKLLSEIGEKDPVLLVIDDVWSESESLLYNFSFEKIQDYKILVTSRSNLSSFRARHKLSLLKQLNLLKHEDARELFLHWATPHVGSSPAPIGSSSRSSSSMNMVDGSMVLTNKLTDELVRRCNGSPLALIVVGRSLCGEHPDVWERKLLELSKMSLVDSDKDILVCLQRSVDELPPRHKEAFLDLGLFPEDHIIPARTLMDMWIELHGLDVDGVEAKDILRYLAAKNLVDLFDTKSEVARFCSYLYVRQHDLLRELAIHNNSQGPIQEMRRLHLDIRENKFPGWCTDDDPTTLNAHLLSISTDTAFTSEWPPLDLPSVEVLILNFQTTDYKIPPFVENMVNLKTLIITNNGFFPVEPGNFDVLESLPNLRRIRLERIKTPSCVRSSGVKVASFFMCEMMDAIAMPNLEEMDLSFCSELESLPTGLRGSPSLKKVSITSCHNLESIPDEVGDLSGLQVLRLNSCSSLSGLPKSIGKLLNLAFLDISDCLSIKELPDEIGDLCSLKQLYARGCSGSIAIPETVSKLDQLEYIKSDEKTAHLWKKQRLPQKTVVESVREDHNLIWLGIK